MNRVFSSNKKNRVEFLPCIQGTPIGRKRKHASRNDAKARYGLTASIDVYSPRVFGCLFVAAQSLLLIDWPLLSC